MKVSELYCVANLLKCFWNKFHAGYDVIHVWGGYNVEYFSVMSSVDRPHIAEELVKNLFVPVLKNNIKIA